MFARAVATRIVDLVLVLWAVSIFAFLMIRLVPGDAVAIMLGANTEITPERLAALRARLGLDQPFHVQYLDWMGKALSGDLGTSIWTGRPVIDEISAHAWPTLQLALLSLVIAAGLAVPLGVLMARIRGRNSEVLIQLGSVIGLTVPSFWLGILMLLAVVSLAPELAVLGYVPFTTDPLGSLARLLLPALALALPILASLARLVRSSMLESLGQDYIRTARAKGLTENLVLYRHALRNALIPFVTSLGIMSGYLLGGAIVVEQVFAIPGLGRLILGAIAERNYPLLQATLLVVTTGFVLANFVVDLLYVAIDPRTRS